jgi:hypothetical protein
MAESNNRPALIEALVGAAVLIGGGWALLHFSGCGSTGDQPQRAAVPKAAFGPPPAPTVSLPDSESASPPDETGPLAEARGQVRRFEKKRQALEPVLERALGEQEQLVAKLREAGVTSPSDLKDNPRGRKLAESLTKLGAEVEGLERQAAALDSAILDAKAVVRRLERQQAGVSEEEMGRLAEQLREAEERTDGAAKPVTPLDVEAALEKALKGPAGQPGKAPVQATTRLVGLWEHHHPTDGSTYSLELTRGDTAILKRYSLEVVGTYALGGNTLTLTDGEGRPVGYSLEFGSAKDVLFRTEGSKNRYGGFDGLAGRWSKK